MRHARQLQDRRRGGDIAGPAWPSIVATTASLSGAAAGITSLLVWTDTYHLRLGVGMAAAGAVFSSLAMLGVRRDRSSRRQLMAAAREDHAAELKYEIGRRDKQISNLKTEALAAEETVVLFEQRLGEEQARADASEAARVRAEHDLAVLTAWVHQTTAAAELTRSAVQSFSTVQPFEPSHTFEPVAVYDSYDFHGGGFYDEVPVYDSVQEFEADYSYATRPAELARPAEHVAPDIDLRPAAAVPLSPILAAAMEQPGPAHRPLRPAVLSVRDEVGFDVAGDVRGPGEDPYLVPGVAMPRPRDGEPAFSARPVPPERLYRPYLGSDGTVDLTMYDETQQIRAVDGRQTGTG